MRSRRKKGLSSIIAGIIIFGIVFSTAYGFYYVADGMLQAQHSATINHNKSVLLQGEENFQVYGALGTQPESSAVAFIPITITNQQSTATPSPFQQLITFNPSSYSSYEASGLGNIRFCTNTLCNSLLAAWLESCTSPASCSSSSTSANVWVKLTSSIGASSSLTIYLAFYPTTTNFDDNYWGEAPQLSSTYGQYDNGANVFVAYFDGNTATSSFSVYSGLSVAKATGVTGPTGSSINAIQISGTTNAHITHFVYNTAISNVGLIAETSFAFAGDTADATALTGLVNSATASGVNNGISVGMGYNSGDYFYQAYDVSGTVTLPANGAGTDPAAGTWLFASVSYPGSSSSSWSAYDAPQLYSTSGGYTGTVTNNPLSSASNVYLGAIGGSATVNAYYDWMRARLYPPGGVMPSVSLGVIDPIPYYVPITLVNTQTSATSANFQQLITFNPSSYSTYEASNLGNIRFCSTAQCSTVYNAWLQSCGTSSCTSSSTTASVWVKLPTPVSAGGSQNLYMAFLPTTTNFDGVYWGEAPQLSSTYAQYDNGAQVFSVYDNFAGTTLSSQWTTVKSSGGSVTVNNGITFATSTSSDYAFIVSSSTQPYPLVSEADMVSNTNGANPMMGETTGTSVNSYIAPYSGYSIDAIASKVEIVSETSSKGYPMSSQSESAINWGVWQLTWSASNAEYASDGVHSFTTSNSSISIANYRFFVGQSNYAAGNNVVQWVRMRAYPPGGVMPSVNFGYTSPGVLPVNTVSYLNFDINNTGPAISVVAYWIYTASPSTMVQYENTTTTAKLPMYIGEGQSAIYANTNITITGNPQYVIKVLTSRGSTAVGTYPSQTQAAASVDASLAGGIGSLQQTFSSFSWYSYVSGPQPVDSDYDYINLCSTGAQCNGGSYIVNLASPEPAAMVPQGQNQTSNSDCSSQSNCGSKVPIVLAVNMTNNDPSGSTITINSETNLWVVETCDSVTVNSCPGPYQQGNSNVGPQGNEMYVFYIVNLNTATGAVTSLTQGSFTPITIPYGTTQTLYFASANDLSQAAFQEMSISSDDSLFPGNNQAYYGEFAAFVLFSGTRLSSSSVQIYGQDVPFSTVISSNNLATYSETPTIVGSASPNVFTLTLSNSVFSGGSINVVTFNATALSSVVGFTPTGWSVSTSNGWITWTNTNTNYAIAPGQSMSFFWEGTAPTVTQTVLLSMPFSIQWSGKGFNYLQLSASAYVTNGNINTPIVPSGVVDFVPITLINSQNTAVAAGTQIMLNVNWATYSSYVDNPVNNVVIFDYNGNMLNAWMENGTASSSTNSIVWVKLGTSDALPAYSSSTIYLGFYPLGNNELSASGPFGEAPQLSSTYAQYDDGALVFLAYFNGNTALTNFAAGSSITISKSTGVSYGTDTGNAIHITGTGTDVTMVYKATALPNEAIIAESNFQSLATPTSQGAVSLDDNVAPGSAQNAIGVDMGYSTSYFSNAYESAGSYSFDLNQQGTATGNFVYGSITYTGPSSSSWTGYIAPELYTPSVAYSGTESSNPLSGATNIYLSVLSSATSSYPDNMNYNWMRARIYPPGGVMPYAIFGSVIA